MHRESESIAHCEERTLVVALGASNLSRGMSRLLQASRCWSSSAVDLVVAADLDSVPDFAALALVAAESVFLAIHNYIWLVRW